MTTWILDQRTFGGRGRPHGRCAPMGPAGPDEHDHDRHGRGRHRGRGPGGPRGRGRGPNGPFGRPGEPDLPGFLPGGPRAGRGDVRAGVLVLLLEGEMHGYQLMHELRERSGGRWQASPGSVYPTLKRLGVEGLVRSTEERGRRRAFALTDEGRVEAERLAEDGAPWEAVGDDEDRDALELRDLAVSVVEAARQVVRIADAAQAAEAKRILGDARRRLYGVLAQDPTDAGATSPERDEPES